MTDYHGFIIRINRADVNCIILRFHSKIDKLHLI